MRGRGIEIDRYDLALLSIGIKYDQDKNQSGIIELRGIDRLMNINWKTLLKYIGHLDRNGFIRRRTRIPYRVELTGNGIARYRELLVRIKDIKLDCSRYSLDINVKISYFMENIGSTDIIIPLLSELQGRSGFDILEFVKIRSDLKDGSRFMSMRKELSDEDLDPEGLLSLRTPDLDVVPGKTNRIDRLLLESDIMRRQGNIEGAMANYQKLLEKIGNLKNGRCAMAEFGLIQTMRYDSGIEEAMNRINATLKKDMSNNLEGLLKRLKADMLSDLGEFDSSLDLYRSAKGHFHAGNAHNLLAICLNNIAVLYFRKGDFDLAESTWNKARVIATKWDIPCARAVVLVNLADVDARNGRIRTARRKLRESRDIFSAMGDLEGVSGADFNEALVNIEDGRKKESIISFDRAMRFPMKYYQKRLERWRVLNDRFKEKGWTMPDHLKTPP